MIQPQTEIGPVLYWEEKGFPVNQLMCMAPTTWINVRIYRKEIAHWMKHTTSIVEFHESMNQPLDDLDPDE